MITWKMLLKWYTSAQLKFKKKNGVKSVLEKEGIFSLSKVILKKNRYFLRKLWDIIFGKHDYFWEVGVLCQRLT